MKEWLTKRRTIVIIGIVIGIAALVVVMHHTYPIIYGKLYSGNHIKLDFAISYEGKQLSTDDFKVECINPEDDNESISKEGSKYAVEGGEHGAYKFIVTVDAAKINDESIEDNIVIELKYINANDWYISDNNCVIEIQNVDGLLNCDCKINTEYNDGGITEYSKEKPIENGKVEFSWGI